MSSAARLESITKRYIGTSRQPPPMPDTRSERMPPGSTYLELDTGRMWYFTGSRSEGDETQGEDLGKWIPFGAVANPTGVEYAILFVLQDISDKLTMLTAQAAGGTY